jgi:hypothetical protein
VVKESRKRKGRGGGAWSREVGCERPRGKGVGRAETSRVRQLPNDGLVSARVRIDVGSWPRENRGNPEGFLASKGALRELWLSYNLLDAGELLASFENLTNLVSLSASNCSLTGDFPSYVVKMSKLERLELSSNSLTGSIPAGV